MIIINSVKSWITWLRAPDQSLLRIEIRWVLRWFLTFPGMVSLIAYVGLDAIICLREEVFKGLSGSTYLRHYPALSLYFFNKLPFWVYFIKRRIGGFLREDRLSELVVTPCDGKMLWPALCMAPITGVAFLFGVDVTVAMGFELVESAVRHFPEWGIILNDILDHMPTLLFIGPYFVAIFLHVTFGATIFAVAHSMPHLKPTKLIWKICIGSYTMYLLIVIPFFLLFLSIIVMSFVLPENPGATWYGMTVLTVITILNLTLFAWLSQQMIKPQIKKLREEMTPEKLLRHLHGDSNSRRRLFRSIA